NGKVTTQGNSGIQLIAGTGSGSTCDLGATVELLSTTISDGNGNGGVKVTSCGDMVVNSSTVSSGPALATLSSSKGRDCMSADTYPGTGGAAPASLHLTMHGTTITTASPRDSVKLVSNNGSVFAGGANCPPNRISGGIESNLTVTADKLIDLSNDCVEIAEN